MYPRIFLIASIILFAFSLCSHAQEVVKLINPSFEDLPRKGGELSAPIKGWHDCGLSKFPGESPPDIHPLPTYAWKVSKQAYDGNTFLGMVTRYNDTYESLSQALSVPLQGGVCYNFTAFVAKSEVYLSATTRRPDTEENFVKPAVLLIWGGNSFCDKAELLGESPPVSNTDWKQYKFLFRPQRTYRYITIEAFYKTPILEAYNGHILLDALSDIVPTKCPMIPQDLVADVSDPPAKVTAPAPGTITYHSSTKTKSGTSAKPSGSTTTNEGTSFKAVLMPELSGAKMYVGQKIRINHLYFMADSVNLLPNSHKVLDELAAFLKAYPKTVIEIGGHTNTIPPDDYCNRLSTARAKSVQEYLISRGIPEYRLEYKGYGKTDPLIANDKYNREWRIKNQRVEIKILSLS